MSWWCIGWPRRAVPAAPAASHANLCARETALNARGVRVRHLEAHLSAQSANITEREAQVRKREAKCQGLDEREAKVIEREAALTTREASLREREAMLAERTAAQMEWENQTEARRQGIHTQLVHAMADLQRAQQQQRAIRTDLRAAQAELDATRAHVALTTKLAVATSTDAPVTFTFQDNTSSIRLPRAFVVRVGGVLATLANAKQQPQALLVDRDAFVLWQQWEDGWLLPSALTCQQRHTITKMASHLCVPCSVQAEVTANQGRHAQGGACTVAN